MTRRSRGLILLGFVATIALSLYCLSGYAMLASLGGPEDDRAFEVAAVAWLVGSVFFFAIAVVLAFLGLRRKRPDGDG